MTTEGWVTLLGSLVSAIIGAAVSIVYRDFRDRPRLRVDVESFSRARHPISLPSNLHAQTRFQGTLHLWVDTIVKWNASKAFEKGEFELSQLKEIRHLLPQFLDQQKAQLADYHEMKASMSQPASAQAMLTLSRIRAHWQKAFDQDVFVVYEQDQQNVTRMLISNFDGDIQQTQAVIVASQALLDWLDGGLNPQTAAASRIAETPIEPDSPRKPFIRIELLAVNSGRTETLINNRATLRCGRLSINLRSYIREYGYDVFSGKFWKVKPNELEGLAFSQDPDHTTQHQLVELRDLIEDGRSSAVVEITDYSGRRLRSAKFRLRDRPQDCERTG